MGLYRDDTIFKIIEDVNNKCYLPDIQRPFVWKPDQIYALFDSIMRKYPINTFLFWQVNKEFLSENKIKKFRFVKNNKEDNSEDLTLNNSEYFLVLDGQQRITSLFLSLKGSYFERRKERELFFNVLSGKEENDEGLLYEFKFLDKNPEIFFFENDKLWVNVKRIYECKDTEQKIDLRNKISDSKEDSAAKKIIEKNIDLLYGRLRSEQILNYFPEEEKDYDKVLDIFVRTNSGGTKLTYSDLLFSTIKLRWKDAREKFIEILDELNGEDFDFDTDFILKTCFVIFAKSQKDVKYSKKNVDDESKINLIIANWDKITESVRISRDLLNRSGINHSKLLTSNNALIPITYFVYKNNCKGYGDSNQKEIISIDIEKDLKNFLLSSLITGLFGGQADAVLYSLKEEIDKIEEFKFPLNEIKQSLVKKNKTLELTEEFLDSTRYNDKKSYLVLNLLYPNIKLKSVSRSNLPEQDHIFSKGELKKRHSQDEINSIYNLRYIPSASNKKKTETPYNEWVKTLSEEEKKLHLLPDGEWNLDTFPDFIKARKKLIIGKLKRLF